MYYEKYSAVCEVRFHFSILSLGEHAGNYSSTAIYRIDMKITAIMCFTMFKYQNVIDRYRYYQIEHNSYIVQFDTEV